MLDIFHGTCIQPQLRAGEVDLEYFPVQTRCTLFGNGWSRIPHDPHMMG